MASLYNLARMTVATGGTGTLTLAGASPGYLTFDAAGVQNGDTVAYGIRDGGNSETGTGVYTTATKTLTRSVTVSTNSNSAIDASLSAEVYITARAEDIITTVASSTDNAIARWNGTGGRYIQNSSATISDAGGLLLTPTAGTGYAIATSQAVSGTPDPGDFYRNIINILDSADSSDEANGSVGLYVQHQVSGGLGGRAAGFFNLSIIDSPSALSANNDFTGLIAVSSTAVGLGGTIGNPFGELFGANIAAATTAAVDYIAGAKALELNTNIATGSTVTAKVGLHIAQVNVDAVSGSTVDAGIRFANQVGAVGWDNAILLDDIVQEPVKTTGTIFKTTGSWTVAGGIDFSSLTITGNFLAGPSFSVSGSGVVSAASIELGHASANTLTASGGELSIEGAQLLKATTAASTYQPLDADLTSWAGVTRATGYDTFAATPTSANLRALLSDETGTGVAYFQGGDAGTPSALVLTNATGLTSGGVAAATLVTAADTVAGNDNDTTWPTTAAIIDYSQPLDATLTSLAAYNTNGLLTQTAADTFTGRTVTGTANQITVANGDGVAGNPTLSLPADVVIPTVVTVPNTGLHLLDTNASHDLIIAPGSNLTADHTLTLTTGDADRTITLSGNPTLADWFDQSVKQAASPTFAAVTIGASVPFSDAAGTLTLQNVDALDATTEATVEAAIDTLANLTSIQGLTVTLADAGADAILGWDDSAGAYENLTQGEVHAVIGTLPVANGGTGQTTEAEAIGEMVQALTADATPDWAADYIPSYDASADTGKKLLLSTVWREKLTAARTYYVRTDGSDSNTGLVDSAGGAFLTIQKAITTVGGLDFSGQTVTISVADGTYTAGFDFVAPWVGGGHLILEGDTTTPANALVDIATGDVFKISVPPPGIFTIRGFKLDTPDGTCISHVSTGTINVNNINFATTTSWQMAATAPGGVISSIGGSLTTSGSAGAFILAFGGGSFLIQGSTITLTGTPAFSVAFVWATRTGFISADGITFSGSGTGSRYLIDAGGTIYTNGGGATYFPGDSAGSGGTTTGGGFYA
jgi:hypothetical protein